MTSARPLTIFQLQARRSDGLIDAFGIGFEDGQIAFVADAFWPLVGFLAFGVVVGTRRTGGVHLAVLGGRVAVALLVDVEAVLAWPDACHRDLERNPLFAAGDRHGTDFFADTQTPRPC